MPSIDFSLKIFTESLIQKWWVLFMAIVVGGMIGAGLSFVLPARYEADARISTSVDYTLLPELQDYEEDRIINEAGWVMQSDAVLREVQEQALAEGFMIDMDAMLDQFSADRIDDLWALRVSSPDPQEAAALANIWVDVSFQHLTAAHAAALEASAIRNAIEALSSCPSVESSSESKLALCEEESASSLEIALSSQTQKLEDALARSEGLNPASVYTLNRYAEVPYTPSFRARGVMAFLGLLLGLAGGLMAIWFRGKKETA